MLPIKLKILLFYLHRIRKSDFTGIKPSSIRRYNAKFSATEKRVAEHPPIPLPYVEDDEIEVRDGAKIPIRIYKPSEEQNLRTIVFYHGGGFVLRNIESHDELCRRIAKKCNSLVVSVGYRLAPEYKFPTPVYDCYDALDWTAENCEKLGGNANKLVVTGDSAGGNLATVVGHIAKDKNGPSISKQVLIYPCLDARLAYPSIDKFGDGFMLTKSMMEWFVEHYQAKPEDVLNPLMSPLLADSFEGLPPAFVITSDHDPLKDEGKAYYEKLVEAGNNAHFKEYKNTIHAFANMPRIMKKANELVDDIARFLNAN